ncbi:hypothetical protein [Shouchella patagoniensis]|uniref:hypothetical protein n=1 Tax=Shouchella patagoniensis TaxID=228576 RepID=UPI000994994A|nr:hypothetical protein [Shouchella patagoniensis]
MPAFNMIVSFTDGTTEEWVFDEDPNVQIGEWLKQDSTWVNVQGVHVNLGNVKRIETKEIDGHTDK